MNPTIENDGGNQFANGQSAGDLRAIPPVSEPNTHFRSDDLHEPATSVPRLDALQQDSRNGARLDVTGDADDSTDATSGGGRFDGNRKRLLLIAALALILGSISPFAWNYLQSYQSTDDAQIDGHIDPLSSRIDGNVIAVHAEDDD